MTTTPPSKTTSAVATLLGVVVGPFAVAALVIWVMSGFSDYEKVASAFVRDVASGRCEAAYQRMASPYRASVPQVRFCASLARNAWFRGATGVSFSRTVNNSGGASGTGTMQRAAGDVAVRVHFIEEGDAWLITNVTVGGLNAVPSPADAP